MCNIIDTIPKQIVSGFKIAIEIDGKFYSPSTGILYSIGKIPAAPLRPSKNRMIAINAITKETLLYPSKHSPFFEERHIRKTQLFKNFNDAVKFKKEIDSQISNLLILKITGPAVYKGIFNVGFRKYDTLLIDEILKMEVVS